MFETVKVALKRESTISKILVSFNPYGFEEKIDPDTDVTDDILEKFFNKEEISDIKENSIEVVLMKEQIHPDDTIEILKKKISEYFNISFEELYLFANYQEKLDTKQVYQMLTQGDRLELTKDRLIQFLLNFENIDVQAIEDKDAYTFEDLMQMNFDDHINKALGQKIVGIETNYPYTIDPFSLLVIDSFLLQSAENMVTTTNKSLLMINGQITNNYIYACLAEDVLAYTETLNLSDIKVLEIYYPYLVAEEITSIDELREKQQQLLINSKKAINNSFSQFNDQIDLYYNISRAMDNLEYRERGIYEISIVLHPDTIFNMPIDIVFKLTHATRDVPLIKYNPGKRQEKIYRLYAPVVSTNGKKIPYLKKGVIFRIMRQIGNLKRVTLYIEADGFPIICEVDTAGAIFISATFNRVFSIDEIDVLFKEYINPHIKVVKDFLEQNGYHIQEYTRLDAPFVEILNLEYQEVILVSKKINFKPIINCVTSVFNIETATDDINLRLKRVANYNEMDSQDALIIELLNRGNEQEAVIQSLMSNFTLSYSAAKERLVSLVNSLDIMKGINKKLKIKNNPGFLTQLLLDKIKNILTIKVKGINHLIYLQTIPIYIEGLIQLTQHKGSIPIANINQLCKHKIREAKSFEELDNPLEGAAQQMEIVDNKLIFMDSDDEDNNNQTLLNILMQSDDEDSEEDSEGDSEDDDSERKGGSISDDDSDASEIQFGSMLGDVDTKVSESSDDESFASEIQFGSMLGDESPKVSESSKNESDTKVSESSNGKDVDRSSSESSTELVADITGMSLHPNPFAAKLQKREPAVFKTEGTGNILTFSRACPWNARRQPIILTQEEKENIDKNHRGSYTTALEYSPGDKKHWYICPRYWSLRDNVSLSEEDIKNDAGEEKYGGIIPPNPPGNKVPEGKTIFEFNEDKYHKDADGNYKYLYPGFLKKKNKNGLCVPCCFTRWNTKKQKELESDCQNINKEESAIKRPQLVRQASETDNYIKGADKFPLEPNRWGYLNVSLQRFLQTDNQKCYINKSNTKLRPNHPCMVRRGVEINSNQSFIATIADVFVEVSRKDTVPSIQQMKTIIINAINLDLYMTYHNGNLVTLFKTPETPEVDIDKYKNTKVYTEWEKKSKKDEKYIKQLIASYENFIDFLNNDTIKIDETYLWDIISKPNPNLFPKGVNIVIIEMSNNDITDNISVKCPSNHYSNEFFDSNKKTLLLLKMGDYYEPIYLLEDKEERYKVTRLFNLKSQHMLPNIKNFLETIKASLNKCIPLPSKPRVYKFKQNKLLGFVATTLIDNEYEVKEQILNYDSQVIGVIAEKNGKKGFVPTYPSAIIIDLCPTYRWMDEEIWEPYESSLDFLITINRETGLPTIPKIKILEDGMIVGILTETNQFVAISEPTQDIYGDDLPSIDNMNFIQADVISNEVGVDTERIKYVKNIKLETNFFNVFRNTVRILLGKYKYKAIRELIEKNITERGVSYYEKLQHNDRALRELLEDHVVFTNYDKGILDSLTTITSCLSVEDCESKKFCLLSQGSQCKLIVPKINLMNGLNNEELYYGRMADELIRYNRIKQFIFQPKNFLTFSELKYNLNDDEIILLQTLLTQDYFEDLVPTKANQYIHQNTYDTANPMKTQKYTDDVDITNLELAEEKVEIQEDVQCPAPKRVALSHKWKPEFGKYFFELIFESNPAICSFNIILTIIKVFENTEDYTIQDIKENLVDEYNKYEEHHQTILLILKNQGKNSLMQPVIKQKTDLNTLIMSEEYYLTNLDILLLAKRFRLPIVLYSGTLLKETNEPILVFNPTGITTEAYFFIKSPGILPNNKPNYRLIVRSKKNKILININTLKNTSPLKTNIEEGNFDLDSYIKTYKPAKPKKRRLVLNTGV